MELGTVLLMMLGIVLLPIMAILSLIGCALAIVIGGLSLVVIPVNGVLIAASAVSGYVAGWILTQLPIIGLSIEAVLAGLGLSVPLPVFGAFFGFIGGLFKSHNLSSFSSSKKS